MGRSAYGVTGIKLGKNDSVVGLEIPKSEDDALLSVTEKGYGKRSRVGKYRLTKRAGKGVINMKTTGRNGNIVDCVLADDKDSVVATTAKGMAIRMPVKGIRVMGRNTQGVRIVRLQDKDRVSSMAKVDDAENGGS